MEDFNNSVQIQEDRSLSALVSQEIDERYLDYPIEHSQETLPLTWQGQQGETVVIEEIPVFGKRVTPRELFHSDNLISKPTRGIKYPFKKGSISAQMFGTESRSYLITKVTIDRIETLDENKRYYLTVIGLIPQKVPKELEEQEVWKFRVEFAPDHDDKRNYLTYIRAKSMFDGRSFEKSVESFSDVRAMGELIGLFIAISPDIFNLERITGRSDIYQTDNIEKDGQTPPLKAESKSSEYSKAAPNGPISPEMAVEDEDFVDNRGGWGWGDRCVMHIKNIRYSQALFACEQGLSIASDANVKGALYYNVGKIYELNDDIANAKTYYQRSLEVRPDNETVMRRFVNLAQ